MLDRHRNQTEHPPACVASSWGLYRACGGWVFVFYKMHKLLVRWLFDDHVLRAGQRHVSIRSGCRGCEGLRLCVNNIPKWSCFFTFYYRMSFVFTDRISSFDWHARRNWNCFIPKNVVKSVQLADHRSIFGGDCHWGGDIIGGIDAPCKGGHAGHGSSDLEYLIRDISLSKCFQQMKLQLCRIAFLISGRHKNIIYTFSCKSEVLVRGCARYSD